MKKAVTAFCVGAAVLLSGCFGGREISKRSFVQIIGIEKDKEIYNVACSCSGRKAATALPM